MTLQACAIHEPPYRIIMDGRPATDVVRDVLYLPEHGGDLGPTAWGIFTRDRRIVPGTAYFRGPGPHLPFQGYTTEVDFDQVHRPAPDTVYVYGGRPVPHYGHFLLGCLPRFWRHPELAYKNIKILIHSPHDLEHLFSHQHVALIFGALGLTREDFIQFDEPTRIDELIVPWPSFEEGHLAYPEFASLCHRIGNTLLPQPHGPKVDRPVYFSKEKMSSGISRLINEAELSAVLQQNGVDIVYPETLAFQDQLRIFSERAVVTGSFGSVFHSSIFAPRCTMLMLNWGDTIYRNFSLIDDINGNDTHYIFPNHDIEVCGDTGGFSASWRLLNPVDTAHQMLFAIEALSGKARGVGLQNIAHRRRTTQSTYADEHRPALSSPNSMAVSGHLSAKPAFHTSHEASPWWQVEFGSLCRIIKVRLFNVVGPPLIMERAAKMRFLASADGVTWQEVFRRVDAAPFGGIDGQPFEWEPDVRTTARFLRLELLEPNFFHLDQVQVFGYPLDP